MNITRREKFAACIKIYEKIIVEYENYTYNHHFVNDHNTDLISNKFNNTPLRSPPKSPTQFINKPHILDFQPNYP